MYDCSLFLSGFASALSIGTVFALLYLVHKSIDWDADLSLLETRIHAVELEIQYAKKFDADVERAFNDQGKGVKAGGYVPFTDPISKTTKYIHDDDEARIRQLFPQLKEDPLAELKS